MVDQLRANAARAQRERVRAKREHERDSARLEFRAVSGRVASEQVDLKFADVLVADPHGLEGAEAGVHAVDGIAAAKHVLDQGPRRPNARARLGREARWRPGRERRQVREAEGRTSERDRGATRAGGHANHARTAEAISPALRETRGRAGSAAANLAPYPARAIRGSATTTAPRSVAVRIRRPIPWRKRRSASG